MALTARKTSGILFYSQMGDSTDEDSNEFALTTTIPLNLLTMAQKKKLFYNISRI